jgi:hypothetical protein
MKKCVLLVPGLLALIVAWLSLPAAPLPAADAPALAPAVNLPMNTATDEDDPFVASDGLTLYYSGNPKGSKWELMIASRKGRQWGEGVVLRDYIRTTGDDRSCCVTPEKRYPQYLYYASTKDRDNKNYDLYVAVKQGPDKAFAEPTPLQITATPDDEMYPWLTADGRSLYFSRKTEDGWRVFVVTRPRAGLAAGFGKPELVKDLPANFHHVTLTPNGETMYLQGPLENERTGLFVSKKKGTGWSKPEPLETLNHPEGKKGDRSPSLSRDGKVLYFASDRPGGKGGLDLWGIVVAKIHSKK